MPRTALVVQEVSVNNGAQCVDAPADQANGHIFDNDGRTRLVIQNGDASSRTVTLSTVACSHGRTGSVAIPIAAGKTFVSSRLAPELFNQAGADAGKVYVDYSASTPTTVRVTAVRETGS